MNYPIETYSQDDYIRESRRKAHEIIDKQINWVIQANNIKEKSPEWYLLMQLKTAVDEDKS